MFLPRNFDGTCERHTLRGKAPVLSGFVLRWLPQPRELPSCECSLVGSIWPTHPGISGARGRQRSLVIGKLQQANSAPLLAALMCRYLLTWSACGEIGITKIPLLYGITGDGSRRRPIYNACLMVFRECCNITVLSGRCYEVWN